MTRAGEHSWAGRRVCVAGLGVSGPPAARVLAGHGALVTVIEGRGENDPGQADAASRIRAQAQALRTEGIDVRTGTSSLPEGTELVVTSPGWRPDAAPLAAARAAGIEVIGDVELAWRLKPPGQRWLAVTGTNGKTTTVRMLEAMLRADGRRARAVGNVGTPIVDAVLPDVGGRIDEILAVELSSFQLHWSRSLRPHAAAVLNVAADHVDWHGDLESYAADKARVYAPGTIRVVNADDEWSGALSAKYGDPEAPAVGFTTGPPDAGGLGVDGGRLLDRSGAGGAPVALAEVADVVPAAPHNVANALAAAALARTVGVSPESVRAGLAAFTPEPHRITRVATVDGVAFIDDSKATNPHAAAASLAAFDSVVWLAGGLLKGASLEELAALVTGAADRLRGAVLIGADRARLADALARHAPEVPVADIGRTDRAAMPEAVAAAASFAASRAADTVLLAPAAASMDMFTDYKDRGAAFEAAAKELKHP